MPNAKSSCPADSLIVPGQQQHWKREYAQHRGVLEDSQQKMRGYLEEHTRAEREALEAASRALREKQQRLLESDQLRAGRRQAEQAQARKAEAEHSSAGLEGGRQHEACSTGTTPVGDALAVSVRRPLLGCARGPCPAPA